VLPEATFDVVLRGYDRTAVDALVGAVRPALDSGDAALRDRARQALARPALVVTMRGYDRRQVDAYVLAARSALEGPGA